MELQDAKKFILRYQEQNPEMPKSFVFTNEMLGRKESEYDGVRNYNGIDDEGQLISIVVPVTLDDQGSYNDVEDKIEKGLPCPVFCGKSFVDE